MPTILAINPKRKGKKKIQGAMPKTKKRGSSKSAKREVKKVAKKRKKRSATKTIVKYRYRSKPRRNPNARAYAKDTLAGIDVGKGVREIGIMFLGAMAAKFSAKRFAEGGAETENWTWGNYGMGAVGTFGAALIASAVFRTKRGVSQNIFKGGGLLLLYKWFTNDIAPMNPTIESWFGQDEDIPFGSLGEDDEDEFEGEDDDMYPATAAGVGDLLMTEQGDYIKAADGEWRPANDINRQAGLGDELIPVDPRMGGLGDELISPDARMGDYEAEYPFQ